MPFFCTECGKQNQDGARFCMYCGTPMDVFEGDATAQSSLTDPVSPNAVPMQDAPDQATPPVEQPMAQAETPAPDSVMQAPNIVPQAQKPFAYQTPPAQAYASIPSAQMNAPAPSQKKKANPLLIVIPAIVVLCAIAAILLFVQPGYLRSSNEPENAAPVATEEATAAPTEVPTPAPDFEAYGIVADLQVGVPTNYITRCDDDETQETVGVVTVDSYERVPVTEGQIAFGRESGIDLTGYERLDVHFTTTFAEEKAFQYGASALTTSQNYYDDQKWRDNITDLTDSLGREFRRYEIDCDGETTYVYIWIDSEYEVTDYIVDWCEYIVYVPAGYDGVVVGVANAALPYLYEDWYEEYIYEHYNPSDYHLFRLN